MRLIVCSVRDSAVDAFSRPFFTPNSAMAIRSFVDEVNRKSDENPIWKHPSDYELFQLADFEEDSGRFFNLDTPRSLCWAADVFAG